MAITNHERVGKALDLLKDGIAPFVVREFESSYKDSAAEAIRAMADDRMYVNKPIAEWDAGALLKLMWEAWNDVFRTILGQSERSLLSELRNWRNKWAHQEPFSGDDADRALDSAERMLAAISASQADEVRKIKMELRRTQYDEQVRGEKRKTAGTAIESAVSTGLKPWREVVTPHEDVASGRYQQAEFAADLYEVYDGRGTDEYRDPVEFFRRTFLTEHLKAMLVGAVRRLNGQGGDPVVQLQTNFGGGKTHSMLALYHLFSGAKPNELLGIDAVMSEADAKTLPTPRRVVLVGNRIRQQREGVAAYGLLLKDIGDLVAEGNEITANRIGIYAESVGLGARSDAVFRGNVIAGNEVGLALQSTARLTFTGNRIAENLADVRALGLSLAPGLQWSRDGRGNSWGQYRGFDADGDGVGDVPHRVEDAVDALVRRNPLIQALLYTPAHLAAEAAARMFPVFRRPPLLVDDRPLMTFAAGGRP